MDAVDSWRAGHVPGQTMANYMATLAAEQEAQGLAYAVIVVDECLAAAGGARDAMQADPGRYELEPTYYLLLDELSNLATIFSMGEGGASEADIRACYATKYTEVCGAIHALLCASEAAKPTWAFLRGSSY